MSTDPNITFWYGTEQTFGQHGRPQRWINVLGNLAPDVAAANKGRVAFTVNGGSEQSLSLGGDLHRLAMPGDFNIEIPWSDLAPGRNTVEVVAGDVRSSVAVNRVDDTQRRSTLPLRVDFSAIRSVTSACQIVDGWWQLAPDGIRTVQRYYDRVLCVGDESLVDCDVTIELTIHDFDPPEDGPPTYDATHFGVSMRWLGHATDDHQPHRQWWPLGAQGELSLRDGGRSCRWRVLHGQDAEEQVHVAPDASMVTLGERMFVRASVTSLGDERSRYRFKSWSSEGAEPLGWNIETVRRGGNQNGCVCLVAHHSDVTIHSVAARPVS